MSNNIKIISGNILSNRPGKRLIIHSCNCAGSWGGGIAYQLATKYPQAETKYEEICEKYGNNLLGKACIVPSFVDSNLLIVCLFTSGFGGGNRDAGESIVSRTKEAIGFMSRFINSNGKPLSSDPIDKDISDILNDYSQAYSAGTQKLTDFKLEMPKINSGIFGVPWQNTEAVLRAFTDLNFTVYQI